MFRGISTYRCVVMGVIATAALAGTAYHLYQSYRNDQPQTLPALDPEPVEEIDSDTDDEDSPDDDTNEEDDLEDFLPIIEALDQDALKRVAVATRLSQISTMPTDAHLTVTCDISQKPVNGSFNLVYFITFSDGFRMVARLPGKGHNFEELDRRKMDNEYQTMRLIKAQTAIPIPEVFTWRTTGSDIGVPFALISFLPGKPICDLWFDSTWATEEKRLKILEQLATHMSQLHKIQFEPKIGSPLFDGEGEVIGIGPRYDYLSGIESDVAWDEVEASGPWISVQHYRKERYEEAENKEEGDARRVDAFIMRLAAESIPSYMDGRGRSFLGHPDLAWHNIFIDDDANVTAIIDWDCVDAGPCSVRFGAYPSWITRDWDPAMYAYEDDGTTSEDDVEESSPAELTRYRQHYAAVFESLALPQYDPRETRLSHIMEAIEIGTKSQFSRDWMIFKILVHAFHGKVPFMYKDFAQQFLAGEGEDIVEMIREAFANMWFAEWEVGANEQALLHQCSTRYWRAMAGWHD